jgi:coenzyme F420-reducing hydrogenase beta subunit
MSNLKRYAVVVDSINNRVQVCETDKGEWVKFDNIKEFLKPTTNTGSPKCERCEHFNNESLADICAGCSNMYISRFTLRASA